MSILLKLVDSEAASVDRIRDIGNNLLQSVTVYRAVMMTLMTMMIDELMILIVMKEFHTLTPFLGSR